MNSLRNVIVVLLLVSSTATLAQNNILVSSPAGAPVDSLARNLGTGLRASLGKQYSVKNAGGEYGARAVREFRSAPADGSQILVVHATVGQPAPDVGGFVPLAVIAAQFATYQWIGVFAPQGTPTAITMDLERAVLAAVNSPGFGQQTQNYKVPDDKWVGSHLTPGSGATLAGLVAQASSPDFQPTRPSPSANSGSAADGACSFAGFDQKIAEWTRRYPVKSSWGMRDNYQYAYFFGSEGLNILQGYRSCLSDVDFAANFQSLSKARDSGRENCSKVSSSGGGCESSYPSSTASSGSSSSPVNARPQFNANGKCISNCEGIGSSPQTPSPRNRGIAIQ